jgi:hypothetical protein
MPIWWKNLGDHNWGVCGQGKPPAVGEIVTADTKTGKTSRVAIKEIVKQDEKGWVATVIRNHEEEKPPPAWVKVLKFEGPPKSLDEVEVAFGKAMALVAKSRADAIAWCATKGIK